MEFGREEERVGGRGEGVEERRRKGGREEGIGQILILLIPFVNFNKKLKKP